MKIAVISSTVFAVGQGPQGLIGYGGLEQLAWQQAEGLGRKGHEVTLVAPDGSRCDHAAVFPTGPPAQHSEEMAYEKYWKLLPEFDAVIDHSWSKASLQLKSEGRLKAPSLCVCHAPVDTMFSSMPPVERPCFVCISEDQGSHFRALFGRDCRVAHNGVDMDFYRPLDVPRSGRFLFLARFSRIKGGSLAIDACRNAGAGLDLVGDTSITNEPEYLEECRKKCDAFPIATVPESLGKGGGRLDRMIRMVGPAKRGECVWWFSQAHCLLHPNFPAPNLGHPGFREPFGLAPVEAMACGTPVIGGNYGALGETVKHGETGWLVRSLEELTGAVMANTYSDAAYFADTVRMRLRCREWAGQFSLPRFIDRWEQLCQEAVETGGW